MTKTVPVSITIDGKPFAFEHCTIVHDVAGLRIAIETSPVGVNGGSGATMVVPEHDPHAYDVPRPFREPEATSEIAIPDYPAGGTPWL